MSFTNHLQTVGHRHQQQQQGHPGDISGNNTISKSLQNPSDSGLNQPNAAAADASSALHFLYNNRGLLSLPVEQPSIDPLNSWNQQNYQQPLLHQAPAVATSQAASMLTVNQDSLSGLLSLLQKNQEQNTAGSAGGNILELIELIVSNNSNNQNGGGMNRSLSSHQPNLPLPFFQQQQQQLQQPQLMMPASHSMTPPPAATQPPFSLTAAAGPTIVVPNSNNDGLSNATNQELRAMIQSLQNKLSTTSPPGSALPSLPSTASAAAAASNVVPSNARKNTGVIWADSTAPGRSHHMGKTGITSSKMPHNPSSMLSASSSSSSSILKKEKGNFANKPLLTPPQQLFAGCTKGKQILLYRDIDEFYLTEYQCLLRQQIELFEATTEDLQASAQGRNSPIDIGQVGIRCKYCSTIPIKCRSRGAVYFPRSIDGIYQVAQNLTKIHLCNSCTKVPENLRKKLTELSKVNKRASGGKRYWIERVREIGIFEDDKAIRFKK